MSSIEEELVYSLLEDIMILRALPLYTIGSEILAEANMNEKLIMVLREIENGKGQSLVSTIADSLFFDRPQVSRLVDTLEDYEFVNRVYMSRTKGENVDRRKVHLEITQKGETFLAKYYEERHQFYGRIIEQFGSKEAKQLQKLIEQFIDLISSKIEAHIVQK